MSEFDRALILGTLNGALLAIERLAYVVQKSGAEGTQEIAKDLGSARNTFWQLARAWAPTAEVHE